MHPTIKRINQVVGPRLKSFKFSLEVPHKGNTKFIDLTSPTMKFKDSSIVLDHKYRLDFSKSTKADFDWYVGDDGTNEFEITNVILQRKNKEDILITVVLDVY